MKEQETIEPGIFSELLHFTAGLLGGNGSVEYKSTWLWRQWVDKFPSLRNKMECANCGASMLAYYYVISYPGATTMMKLGQEVDRRRREDGLTFTQANKLHVVKLAKLSDTERHQTTILRFLGLLAKVLDENGRQQSGLWCITARGFAFLRGEAIPKKVKVFRNELQERYVDSETTTLGQVLAEAKSIEVWDYRLFESSLIQGKLL